MKRDTFKILAEKYESVYTEEMLRESFDKDLKLFEQYLVQEGLWDTIKQKGSQLVGGAKNALIQPLVKMVLNQIAQSDPEGYKRLQAAAQDPQQLQALLNSPEVQQQQQAIGQDVAATAESIADDIYYEYLNEAYGNLVDEAWIDPKTGRFVKAGTPGAVERKTASRQPVPAPATPQQPAPAPANPQTPQQPAPAQNQQPSTAVKAIGKVGDVVSGAGQAIGKGAQALGQSKVGQAAGGFISKAVNWVKQHPKISLAAGLALLAATGGAAAIGAGGIVPLITSTLGAAGAGAAKGGIIGGALGAAKDVYGQVKSGNVRNLGDINLKQTGKAALKTGAKGAAVGAAVGAGANILGKAAAGVGDIASGNYGKAMKSNNGFTRDLTPGEKRSLGVDPNNTTTGLDSDKAWAKQYDPNDMNTWKVKPKINSTQGYLSAQKQNDLLYKAAQATQDTANQATGLQDPSLDAIKGTVARSRANEIVDSLIKDEYGNLVNPYDVKFANGLNLNDVFDAAKIQNNMDSGDIMRWVKTIAQQKSPKEAAEFLTKYITQGTNNLGITPLAPQ